MVTNKDWFNHLSQNSQANYYDIFKFTYKKHFNTLKCFNLYWKQWLKKKHTYILFPKDIEFLSYIYYQLNINFVAKDKNDNIVCFQYKPNRDIQTWLSKNNPPVLVVKSKKLLYNYMWEDNYIDIKEILKKYD